MSRSPRRLSCVIALIACLGCRSEPEWAREPAGSLPFPQPLSVKIAPGRFFFAENGTELCAIRFTNEDGWDRAAYESYRVPQSESGPSFSDAQRETGNVFEILKVKDEYGDKRLVEDAGSQVSVTCGDSSITWSSGNWIYSTGDWRFAVTQCATFECAENQYASVTWEEHDRVK